MVDFVSYVRLSPVHTCLAWLYSQ